MAQANVRAVITAEDRASSVLAGVGGSFGKLAGAMAVGQIAAQALSKAISVVTDNVGAAVKRVDTLNNANRVFSNMGFAGDAVKESMDGLKASILGLPTPLDSAVRGMQMIASSTGDIGKSQKIFSALNDAILGFGGSADMVENSVLQLSQAFSNGRIDAQTWNSMMQSGLGPTLNAIAKQMKLTTGQLKEGLGTGSISVKKFQDALIDLDKNGGGGLKSLQQIAKDSTAGINTGMENAKTAMVRGMANIITAIGPERISGAISKVGDVVEKAFTKLAKVIPSLIDGIKGFMEKYQQQISAIGSGIATALRMIFDTLTGGDPTIKESEAKFAGFAKALLSVRDAAMNVFEFVKNNLISAWNGLKAAIDFLLPSILSLWDTITNKLWPALQNIYENVIVPLNRVLGVVFVAAIWALVNAFNAFLVVVSAVTNFLADNPIFSAATLGAIAAVIAVPLVGAFIAWASAAASAAVATIAATWPILLIGAAIGALVYLVVTHWETIKNAFFTALNFIVEKLTYMKDHFWEILGTVIGFFATLLPKIQVYIIMAILWVINYLMNVDWGGVAKSIGNAFSNMWNGVKDAASKAFDFIKNIKWGEVMTGIGKGIGNAVLGLIEGTINGAISGIPGMKKVTLPRFASGVQNFSGGTAIVGEQGPELVQLPQGSNVVPNHRMGGAASTTVNISLNVGVYAGSEIEKRKLAKDLFSSLQEVANQRNTTVAAMMGA